MKADSTKLTVSKSVVERVRTLLEKKKIDLSITQFAEHILTEACAAAESDTPPDQLPTITWIRQKLGKSDMPSFLQRLSEIEQLLGPPKKLSA